MSKRKKLNYWYWLIIFVMILLICGVAFEYGESFGKALAN